MKKKLRWLHAIILAFSAVSCSHRPNADLCLVDAARSRLICYHMRRDFDEKGQLKQGARPEFKAVDNLAVLDKFTVFDPDSWSEVKAWIKFMRENSEVKNAKGP